MFVRLKPDVSGAYLLDPKFKLLNNGTVIKFAALNNEPPDFAKEALVAQAYHPDAPHEKACEKIWPLVVSEFSKRKNVTLIAHGISGLGKSYTLDYVVPVLLAQLKPVLQNAEQVAAEAAAEAQEAGGMMAAHMNRRKTMAADGDVTARSHSRSHSHSHSHGHLPSPPRGRKTAASHTIHKQMVTAGYADSITLSPKVIVARASPKSRFRSFSPTLAPAFEVAPAADAPPAAAAADEEEEVAKRVVHAKPGLTYLRNNGRKGNQEVPVFGGGEWASYCHMPAIPNLHHLVLACTIELWVKTSDRSPCTLFCITSAEAPAPMLSIELGKNVARDPEQNSILFYVADKMRKELSMKITKDIFDDRWHHLQWEIQDLPNNRMALYVDGQRVMNVTLGEVGNPSRFPEEWPQYFSVGAAYNHMAEGPRQMMHDQFRGSVVDLKIFDRQHELLCHWPFDEQDGTEIKNHGRLPLNGELVNATWQTVRMPDTAMYFNGKDSYINVGCLGDFGSKVNNCALDLWFRTNNSSDRMALFHVTDSKKKQSCFGIDLNTNDEWEYCKGVALFYVKDASGKVLSGTLTADLCNDAWHSISWKITGASTNQMTVMLDGIRVDLDYAERGSPSNFEPWSQWVCIGAANRRGRSIAHYFRGYMKEVRLWHSGHVLAAHWELGEGIGAKVAMDMSGNGHNGICRVAGHWGAQWLCVDLPAALDKRDDGLADYDGTDERKFDNNRIRFSYLQLYSAADSKGLYQERLWDTLHSQPVDGLQPVVWKSRRASSEDFHPLAVIPDGCWVDVTADGVAKEWEEARRLAQSGKGRHGHHIITLALGDSCLTLFDLKGLEKHRQASFDRRLYQWTLLKSSLSAEEKAKGCVLKSLTGFEQCLLQLGANPQLFKRAIHRHNAVPFHDSTLTQLLESAVCFGEEPATLVLLETAPADPTVHEAAATVELLVRMRARAQLYGAITLQKTLRAFRARKRCRIMNELRDKERARARRAADLQKRFPEETRMKDAWVALVIGIARYDDPGLTGPCHAAYDTDALAGVLAGLGYDVTHMHCDAADETLRPSRANILAQLDALNGLNAQVLVFISCLGAHGIFYNGPEEQDFQDEYAWHVRQQELAAARAEAERRRQEEAARRQAEAEAEARRLAEEAAAAAAAAAEAEKKKAKGKGEEKDTGKKPSPKKGKGKKAKAEEALQPTEANGDVEDKAEVEEEAAAPVFRPRPDSDPTIYLMPSDARLEIAEEEVLTLEQLRERVLGADAHLGVHAIFCVDLAPPGDPYWWQSQREGVPADGERGVFMIEFSSRDSLQYSAADRYSPIGSYYFIKGISGCAHPPRRGDVPEVENNRVTIDSLLRYLSFKLRTKTPHARVQRTDEGSQDYIGELIPATKLLFSKGDRREKKRAMRRKRYMLRCEFSVPVPAYDVHHVGPELYDIMVQKSGPGEKDNMQLCAFDVLPHAYLYFRGSLVDTRRVLNRQRWVDDLQALCAPLKVRHSFEPASDGRFRVHLECVEQTPEHNFELRSLLTMNAPSARCADLPIDRLELHCSVRVACNPQQQAKLEKHYRLGDFHSDMLCTAVQFYSEDQAKLMDEQDKRDAEARERQAAELERQKRVAAEAQRQREAQLEQEQALVGRVLERCEALAAQTAVEKDDDIAFIFQFPHNAVTTAAAVGACAALVRASAATVPKLAELGVVEFTCQALAAHRQEDVALPCCALVSAFSLTTARVKVVDDIDDLRKGIIKLGGVPPLVDTLRSYLDHPDLTAAALQAVAGMAASEARTLLAQRGAVDLVLAALQRYPAQAATALWALDGLAQRATPEQQPALVDVAVAHMEGAAAEDPVLLGRAYGLLARLAPLLPAARQRCEAVAPAVADGMERFVKHGTVLAGGVSLLAEIPEGPVLNGLLAKGLLKLAAQALQTPDPVQVPRGVLSACALLERLRGTPALKAARPELEGPLKALRTQYGDAVADKAKGALAAVTEG